MHRVMTLVVGIAVLAVAGCNQQSAVLDTPVRPSPAATPIAVPAQPEIASLRISPGGVDGGDGATGVVTLAGPAQVFPVTVAITSNNEAAIVTQAIVPAGSTIGRFGVSTRRFPDDRVVVISASTPGRTIATNFEVWAIDAPVYFKYFSDEGDFVGGGTVGRFIPGSSTISAVCERDEVRIQVSGRGQQWSATFQGGASLPLTFGPYEAIRAGTDGERSGLNISGQGRSCDSLYGKFVVEELDLRNNRVNLFKASFQQYCDGENAGLYGEVRVENMPPSGSGATCFR